MKTARQLLSSLLGHTPTDSSAAKKPKAKPSDAAMAHQRATENKHTADRQVIAAVEATRSGVAKKRGWLATRWDELFTGGE
jgi:TorA maturation chaperone TorD